MIEIPKTIKQSTYDAIKLKSERPETRNPHTQCIYFVLKAEVDAGRVQVIEG